MNLFLADLKRLIRAHWSRRRAQGDARRQRERLVEEAIERAVDHANPRLRGLPGYRHKLAQAVGHSLDYSACLARRIPGPITLNRETWAQDPLLNALFANPEQFRQVLSNPEVRAYVNRSCGSLGDCYAILSAVPELRQQLGMELNGETVQRDIRQTTMSFTKHEVRLAGGDPDTVRTQAAEAIMDALVEFAAEEIGRQEAQILEVEERLRMARIKQKVVSPAAHGLALMGDDSRTQLAEYETLAQRITELEKALAYAHQGLSTLDDYLVRFTGLLQHPETQVAARLEHVRLDRMNVVREDHNDHTAAAMIEFLRTYRRERPGRIVLLVRFTLAELITPEDRLAEAERYVNA